MRAKASFRFAVFGAVAGILPVAAQARVVNTEIPGIRISGSSADLSSLQYEAKTIHLSFENDDDWTLRCGEYVAQALILRLGPQGQQHYQRRQLARILGSIDRIEIRRVRGGLLGTPRPSSFYYSGDRRLVVEFDINSSESGMEYCGFGNGGGTLRAVHQAWARFERLSRRRDDAEASLAVDAAPGSTGVRVDVQAGDVATSHALGGFMTEALNAVGGVPAAPPPAPTERRTAPGAGLPTSRGPESTSPPVIEAR